MVRVPECKSARIQAFVPVDFHAGKIDGVRRIHDESNRTGFKKLIMLLAFVEAENIRKAGAAAAFDAYSQKCICIKARFLHQSADLFYCTGTELQGRFCLRFHKNIQA